MAKTSVKMVNGKPVAVDPDQEPVTPQEAAGMKAAQEAQSRQNKIDSDTEDMKQNPINKARGGKIDFSQIIRNRKTGVLSMKKSTGGMVRGAGCAERGKGKGTVY